MDSGNVQFEIAVELKRQSTDEGIFCIKQRSTIKLYPIDEGNLGIRKVHHFDRRSYLAASFLGPAWRKRGRSGDRRVFRDNGRNGFPRVCDYITVAQLK